MNLKNLRTDDDAVSPVIGVILMVAITVILAAVIASFVLGLGEEQQTTPKASFDFDLDTSNDEVDITYESGDSIQADRLTVTGGGSDVNPAFESSGTDVTSGSTVTDYSVSDGDTVKVVWKSENGETSSTLATYEVDL